MLLFWKAVPWLDFIYGQIFYIVAFWTITNLLKPRFLKLWVFLASCSFFYLGWYFVVASRQFHILSEWLPCADYLVKCLFFLGYCLIFTKGQLLGKVVVSLNVLKLSVIAASVVVIIYGLSISQAPWQINQSIGIQHLIYQLFAAIVFFLLSLFLRYAERKTHLSEAFHPAMIIIDVLSLVFISVSKGTGFDESTPLFVYTTLVIWSLNFAVQFLLMRVTSVEKEKQNVQSRLDAQAVYIQQVADMNEAFRTIRHDIKGHIQSILTLLQKGQTDSATTYLRSLAEEIPQGTRIAFSKSDVINGILSDKNAICKREGISFEYMISGDYLKVADLDMSAILNNLLNNAIEASQKEKEQHEPHIVVKIGNEKGYLKILVENRISQSVLNKNAKLLTTKPDQENHGYGLKVIKKVVQKYNGLTDFYERSGYFVASIRLNILNINESSL